MSILSDHVESNKQALGTGHAPLPKVNLLPPEIGEAVRFRKITYGLGGGLLAAVGVVALLYVAAVGSVNDFQSELDAANTTNAALQARTAEFAEVQAVYARAAAAEAMLTQAMGEEVRYSQFLNGLSLTVPENVWVTNIAFAQAPVVPAVGATEPGIGTATFSGVGFKHDDVALWLESLATQDSYVNPYFTSSTLAKIGERETVDFSSTVTMTADALSGRYTTPAGG